MGRPRTDIGTFGDISVRQVSARKWEARARFRTRNGQLKPVSRRAESKTAAVRKLKAALAELVEETTAQTINPHPRMTRVMDLWLAGFEEKVTLGKRAAKSYYDYRDVVNNHLRPLMGDLTCMEAENAGLCNEVLKTIRKQAAANTARAKNGEGAMKRARTVLSNVCTEAVMYGAMKVNPVKSVERFDHDHDEVRALEPEERGDFLERLRVDCARRAEAVQLGPRARAWLDLPELVEAMLSTGLRIGEALALIGDSVDLDAHQVHASHHLVREEGRGIIRKPKRKGDRPGLKAPVLSWTASMWRRRKLESGGVGPLFPSWNGQWLDPGNVAKRLNKVCVEIGYGWVSSRYFRHTTATHLGDSDLTDNAISDALGNTPEVVRRHYRRKRGANPMVAAALESMLEQPAGT